MNADRELLEAAAKAAGILLHHRSIGDTPLLMSAHGAAGPAWNPLEDDGDALRLVVELQMDVFVRGECVEAVAPMGAPQKKRYGAEGPRAAARRAITCAAAAMPARRVFGAA